VNREAAPMRELTFYFDFVSPYAYLAWSQIHALAARRACEVVPRPLLFAALLDANGQKGPAEIARKRAYTFKDVVRTADRLGVSIAAPASHPFNPLLALRVASADMKPEQRRALVDALFLAAWGRGLDVTDPNRVAEIVGGVADLDAPGLLEWAKSADAKERVRRTTAEALDAGAFGVPTMIVERELFWGLDSFANLDRYLDGKDPVGGAAQAAFAKVAPSASRPGATRAEEPYRSTRDVIVRTEDFEAAARFYEDVLGFRPTLKRPKMLGFETGAFQLFVEKGPSQPPVFEVRAKDAKQARVKLLSAGCKVVEEDPRVPRCYLVDPYGFVFNLEEG
jgi:2-hydroxychromene-2-carboxylate isomerase/predicted enzyme related to lactoylglutathione lyase